MNSLFRGLIVGIVSIFCVIGCTDSGSSGGTSPIADTGGKKRLILLTNTFTPFWSAGRVGVETFAKEYLGETDLIATLEANDGTVKGQIDKLRQYGTQNDVAGVAVSVTDADNAALADEMRKLRDKGVFVLTVDSDLDPKKFRDARYAYLGTNNVFGGEMLGRCAKILRPDGGGYVTFVGQSGAQNAIERISGVGMGAGEKFKKLDSMSDEGDRSRARENVRNAIRNHAELNCLAGIWSYNAPAIVDVVKELKKREEMAVVCFDAEPQAIRHLENGMIDALVVQNPYQMGYQSMKLLAALVQDDKKTIQELLPDYGKPDGDIIDTGIKVIAPDKETPLKAEQFGESVEFQTVGTFRKWLDQHNLKGS